jgi:hypothetical protein
MALMLVSGPRAAPARWSRKRNSGIRTRSVPAHRSSARCWPLRPSWFHTAGRPRFGHGAWLLRCPTRFGPWAAWLPLQIDNAAGADLFASQQRDQKTRIGNPLPRGDLLVTVAIPLAALALRSRSATVCPCRAGGTVGEPRPFWRTCARRKTQVGRLRWSTHYSPFGAVQSAGQLNLSASQGD